MTAKQFNNLKRKDKLSILKTLKPTAKEKRFIESAGNCTLYGYHYRGLAITRAKSHNNDIIEAIESVEEWQELLKDGINAAVQTEDYHTAAYIKKGLDTH